MEAQLSMLLAGVFTVVTQIIKVAIPEKFEQAKEYIVYVLVGVGMVLSMIYTLAFNPPVDVNVWLTIWEFFGILLQGALLGLSAVGLYKLGQDTPGIRTLLKSSEELVEGK